MNTYRYLTGAAVAALLCAAPAAYAQQTTAAVRGVVESADGTPVGGAELTVVHTPSGTRATTRSDTSGVFDLRGLRVGGPYEITVTADGFSREQVSDIFLTVGDASNVKIALKSNTEVSEVIVTAEASRLASAGSSTNLRRDDIVSVVSSKRDIRDLGRRDPLATLDLGVRGTGPSGGLYIAGSTPRSNRITIDGVRSQDDFGLNTGGLSTNRGPISPEAIEQFAIQAVPFDVEEGDFTGGALNMVMRSGGNDFHGSLFGYFRDGNFVGHTVRNVAANGSADRKFSFPIDEKNYGAFLSGPILQDRLFFALSYEKFETIDVTDTGPADKGFTNLVNGFSGAAGPKMTQAELDSVLGLWNGYASSAKLKPGEISATKPVLDEKSSIKIDWNINDDHRLSAIYRHAFSSVWKRQNLSATAIAPDTNWYTQPENEDNYSLQLNSNWTDRLSTEARLAFRGYQRGQMPPTGQNFSQINICTDATTIGNPFDCNLSNNGQPQVIFGPDQFRHANVLKTKDWAGSFVARYRLDDHLLKVGYQFKDIEIFNLFVPQARGIYYFDSLADFKAGKAGQLSYQNAVTGKPADAAAALVYDMHTLFAQDSWQVTPELSVDYGLRYDFYVSDSKPALNPNFVGRFGFKNQMTYDGLEVLAPRVSAKWDDGRFKISGGVGLVSGGLPDVFLGNRFSNTGILTNGVVVRRLANGTFLETGSQTVVDPLVGASLLNINVADSTFGFAVPTAANTLLATDSATRRTAETNSLAPDFKMPTDWKANISLRTDFVGFTWGVDAVAVRSDEGLAFRDLRARKLTINGMQQYTPDGRLRYDGLNMTAAARATAGLPVSTNPDLVNLGSTRDIQAFNPGEESWSSTVAFSVSKRFSSNLEAGASFALQDSSLYGGLPEFATTDSGLYGEQYTSFDPNGSTKGRAANTIRQAVKLNLSYEKELIKGHSTRVTLFGDMRSGRPINFLMADLSSGRSPVFGVNRSDMLAFVPQTATPDAANPLKFTTNGTTVFFDSATSLAQFRSVVEKFELPNGIVPKGHGENPSINRFDLQLAQELPVGIPGHKLLATLDVQNLGNLLSSSWGVVKEYSDSRSGGRIVSVQCANAAGVAQTSASAVCEAYRFSNVSTSILTPTVNPETSTWSIQLGLKYQF